MIGESYKAYRCALIFILVSIYIKIDFLIPLFKGNRNINLEISDLFPGILSSTQIIYYGYFIPLLTLPCLLCRDRWYFIFSSIVLLVFSLCFSLHLDTYNDATFNTSLWCSVWLLLLSISNLNIEEYKSHILMIAKLLVSMIFLGGFIGKLTPEYWRGDVLHDLYFMDKYNFIYPKIRSNFQPDTIKTIAHIFSLITIFTEGLMSICFLFSKRWFIFIGSIVCSGIVLFSHPYLFSVMGPLMAIIISTAFIKNTQSTQNTKKHKD